MNSNEEEINNIPRLSKGDSVVPKRRKHVSTMIGTKIVEIAKHVVKTTVSATKSHANKGKINPETCS